MEREEAIKIARKLYNKSLFLKKDKEAIVTLIPELAENEDERIKKEIIAYFKSDWAKEEGITRPDWIAWLEKQGEISDKIVERARTEKQRILVTESDGVANIDWDTRSLQDAKFLMEYGLNYIKKKLEKQGEQKPADKIEPKFKVGDWVVYHRNDSSTEIMNVYDIRDNIYYFNDNIHFSWSVRECDEKCHIWTIQDAKDGDVLVTKVKEQPFIFKGLLDEFHPKHPVAYCGIDFMNEFMISVGVSWWTDVEVKPATKEQRDTLMKAMADAGYTFDFDKKVLKKIKQKPTDEEMKEVLRTEYEKGRADVIAEVQKLGWSEEDEKMISDIATYLNRYGNYVLNKNEEKAAEIHKAADWIKSLKDKVYI